MIEPDINEQMARFAPSQNPADPGFDAIEKAVAGMSGVPMPKPEPVDMDIDRAVQDIAAQRRQDMASSLMAASEVNPDEAAQADALGRRFGVGQDIALRNMSEMRRQAMIQDTERMDLLRKDPVLARYIADREFAAQASDDVGVLSMLRPMVLEAATLQTPGGFFRVVGRGYERGQIVSELGDIGAKTFFGFAEQGDFDRAKQLQDRMQQLGQQGLLGSTAEMIAQNAGQLRTIGTTAAGGAAIGSFFGPPGLVIGGGLGAAAGIVIGTGTMEAGNLYLDMRDQGVSDDAAIPAAIAGGFLNGVIEVVGMKIASAPFKALASKVIREEVSKAIAQPTMRSALIAAGKAYGLQVGGEAAEEGLQEIVAIASEEIAKAADGIDSETSLREATGRVIEAFAYGGMASALLGGIGPGANLVVDLRRANATQRQQAFFDGLVENRKESKLAQRNPQGYERFLAAQAQDTPAETIYVDAATARDVLAQSGTTTAQLEDILPGIRERLEKAVETGGDVTIPTSQFGARLANTELGNALLPHMRLSPEAMSATEAQAFEAQRQAVVEEARTILATKQEADAAFVAEAQQVEDEAFEQVRAVGQFTDIEARTIAKLRQAMVVVDAAEAGMTPAQYQRERGVPLQVRGVQGEVAPVAPLEQPDQFDQAGQRRTDTPQFRAWSNNAQLVTKDQSESHQFATGVPVVVEALHGSIQKGLRKFDVNAAVEVRGAIFFSSNEEVASQYTFERAYGDIISDEPLGEVISAYVSFQNPMVYAPKGRVVDAIEMSRVITKAKELGHDGVIIQNIDDSIGMTGDMGNVYVTWNPTSIKSTDNSGAFSRATADIYNQAATLDADYLAAIERGDMATAQRMVDEAAMAANQQRVTRFTVGGRGLLNNQVLNYDKLSDDEMAEVEVLLPLGLQQPRDVPANATFFFTDEGLSRHARLIELLKKAARGRVTETAAYVPNDPVWTSSDGQVAVVPEQIKSADPVTRDEQGNIVPLSRRFDITSPKLFEQAAVSRVSGLGAEAARKLRESAVADGGKNVKDITADQVITDERIPTITLQDLVGKRIFPTIADRTAAGVIYTGIDSSKVNVAIELLGGPLFPLRESNFNAGVVWADRGKEVISAKGKKVAAGADYMIVLMGDADMHKSNTTVANVFFATLDAYVRDGRITKKNAAALTKMVKDSVTKDASVQKYIEKFPGLDDSAKLEDYLHSISFTARARLIDILGSKAALELGAPSMARILDATREESMAGHRWGDGVLVVKIDKDEPFITLGEGGTRLHPDFPLGMRGQVVGKLDAAVNYELLWKDWLEKQKAAKLKENPDAKVNLRRAFELAKPELDVTQELVDRIGPIQQGNIDSSRQAMLAVDMALDRWRTSDVAKNKGGASPQGFVDAVANSPANVVLNEYKTEEVKAAIKDGSMSIYQLGDETSGIWFALKKGNPATEYGIQIEGLNDTDVTLTAVVNNEQGARGIGAPAVVLKALQKGATVLDCFAVQSARFPDGFLPTLYREFGFEVVGEVPFEPKYYSKQKLADAEKFWTESGWDKNKYGYPRVVIMKWRGTDEDRAGITERYLRDGIAGVLSGGASANAQAAAALFGGDAGAQVGATVGTVEGRVAGTERPVAQRSLAFRAVGIARDIAALTDNEARNLGISTADRDAIASGLQPGGVFSQSGMVGILEQAAAGPARGGFDPRTLNVLVGKGGDVSTLAHELIHLRVAEYLRMARGTTPPARVNADLETLFDFMGVDGATFQERLDNYETMTIDQRRPLEEKVTYNFEVYLYEGKAPSVELRGVFDRLAAWMRRVYKSIRDDLNAIYRREFGTDLPILTPEVRAVFDRMLASEEQIKRQEAIDGMKGLFQTQAESGMDNAEWAAYQAMQQEATEAAVTDLNTASMRQVQWLGNARARILRDLQKKHDAKRKEVTAEVAAAVKVEPVYRAMTYLRYGRFVDTDGAEVEVEGTHRLDIEKVRAMYASLPSAEGVELIRATGMAVPANVRPDITPLGTGKYGMLGRDGLDPDVVAEMFGYGSGDEMVRALLAAKPMKDAVAERTDAEMLRRYGDMNTPAALEAEVQKALHNEARARFVAVELRHIAKATQPVRVMLETAKQVAADMISDTTIRDLRPGEFVAAEARAARDAERIQRTYGITEPAPELAQRYGTDRQQALIRAKRAQLYQNQLASEALRVKEYVDKQVKYLRGVMRDSNVKRMGAAAADQVAGLLERFEVAPVSLKRLDERRSMAQFLADLEAAGVVPDIAEEIANEARRVNYKELKVSEFRDLVDAVKQIEHIGKNEQKMRLAEERAAFEEVRDDVVTRIRAVGKVRELQIDPRTPLTGIGRTAAFLRGFAAQHLKAASIARILDGGKEDGPLWNAIIRTANEAADFETRRRAEASLKLGEILKPVFALGGMGGKGMYFPSIGRSLNREARIAIALNLGNDGNRQRLLDGEGWTLEQLQPVLESLTEAEWLAVQKVWDFIDGYRPEIAAKERRLYGKEPEWVKPTPFTVRTSDGKEVALQGGYYPVKYDPVASDRVATVDAAEEAKRDLQGAYTAATTRRSFVKARAKEVRDRPLLYTLDAAFSGVNDVIHDLAWHEWLISTNRLLRDPKFANAVRETRGPEFLKQLRDWSKDNATGARGQQVAGESVLSWLRQGISASGLGFNVVSAAMQVTGFNQSIVRVGAKYIGQGIVQFSTSPFESAKTVAEKSSFMAERGRTQFREINEIKNRVRGQTEVARRVTAGTYFLMMNMQRSVDIPTWLGAYQKALDAGKDDAKAVALADQAVRDSQGSGLVSDLAAMERGGPAMKLFTVFYSYMNTVYNMTAVQTMTARGKGKLAADYAMLLVVPVVLGYAIKSVIQPDAGDDELDPEALARKLAAEELSYLMGTMVIAREFGGAAQLLTGAEGVRMGYGGPAGLRAVGEVYGLATQAGQLEFDRAFRRAAINTLGAFTGLPSAQINRTIDGIEALVEGEVEGPSAVLAPLTGVQR
jgi:hypothetical protein